MSYDEIVIDHTVVAISQGASRSQVKMDLLRGTNFHKNTVNELMDKALARATEKGIKAHSSWA